MYEPGIDFTFLFATQHGIHNGYPIDSINSYIKEMIEIFKQYNFNYIYLYTLWDKYGISFEKIDSILNTKLARWWEIVPEYKTIEKNASHRNKKYPPELAAQKYYIMRDLEKGMFEKEFPRYIFHAFSSPKLRSVLPNMPTLYFWGIKKWRSDAPWFVVGEK